MYQRANTGVTMLAGRHISFVLFHLSILFVAYYGLNEYVFLAIHMLKPQPPSVAVFGDRASKEVTKVK